MNLKFNRNIFFEQFGAVISHLTQSQVEGLEALLTGIETDPEITDIRWAAYMLATVRHECANKYQPLEEYGKGKDHSYGKAVKVTGSDGQTYTNVYYGRGYVQLTWDYNYRNLSAALGYGDELLCHPNRVLQKDVAYKIMSYGMRNGIFTKHSLHEFISGGKCNYHGARKIINGLDKADLIAGYAKEFEQMLIAAQEAEPAQVDEIPTGNPSETDLSQTDTSSAAQAGSQALAGAEAANGSASNLSDSYAYLTGRVSAAGDQVQSLQSIYGKFGFSNPDAKRGIGTVIFTILKVVLSIFSLGVAFVRDNWEWLLMAAVFIGLAVFLWNKSGSRKLIERLGIVPPKK